MDFEVQILGSNSAIPSQGRHPTSQLLKLKSHTFLIDCGEGTLMQLQKYKCKPFKIECIFISHLHGDHYFGLMAILSTYHLLRRPDDLTIIAPPELQQIVELQLAITESQLCYNLKFIHTQATHEEIVYETDDCIVKSFPLEHRVPCTGFLFQEKTNLKNIDPEKIKGLSLSNKNFHELKAGLDITDLDGKIHKNEDLILPATPPRSYIFCTDTKFLPEIVKYVKGASLLYHEATFSQEYEKRAEETYHSTTIQAATIAKDSNVGQLIIGHFSSKYSDLTPLLNECKGIFPNTELAIEGHTFQIKRE
ncbi:MAG: ribonuclease Z [Chitinophagales bacterium]|nr:ribonuclease Z [Chitinophagales bacterium]